jgi:hypothetical protein
MTTPIVAGRPITFARVLLVLAFLAFLVALATAFHWFGITPDVTHAVGWIAAGLALTTLAAVL